MNSKALIVHPVTETYDGSRSSVQPFIVDLWHKLNRASGHLLALSELTVVHFNNMTAVWQPQCSSVLSARIVLIWLIDL